MKPPKTLPLSKVVANYLLRSRNAPDLISNGEGRSHSRDTQQQSEPANPVKFHDALADGWDEKYRSGGFQRRADFFRRKIAPSIGRPGRWLDAGCGSGFFSRVLAGRDMHLTGLDASAPMIASARQLAKLFGLCDVTQFELVEGLDRLSFADASFAGCICLSVIEYLDRPDQCLDELARVVEPGGFLVVSVPHANSSLRFAQRLVGRALKGRRSAEWSYLSVSKFETTPFELENAFVQRGFTVTGSFGFDPLIPEPLRRVFPPSLIFAIGVKKQRFDHPTNRRMRA
jgi:2-polyprenyl-6-hydroxyphenyl methylase/3-demethylubiquinone-9 3-methyltransferase